MKKDYLLPLGIWLLFEAVAVALWLTLDNLFYLFNFSYIGTCLAVGILLYSRRWKYARSAVQLAVGLYMLVYLGLISNENMQIEGFWYYLFAVVFEAAVIHYAVAKIFGPLLFGRGWCGYACWTAMVLDLLPYKRRKAPRKKLGEPLPAAPQRSSPQQRAAPRRTGQRAAKRQHCLPASVFRRRQPWKGTMLRSATGLTQNGRCFSFS